MDKKVKQLSKSIVSAVKFLFASGVMEHSGHGNISARINNGEHKVIFTGGRGSLRDLTADELVVVSMDGKVLEGNLEAVGAEVVQMHLAIYKARKSVGSIIHTHSPHATAFAMAHEPLPCDYESLLRFEVGEPIPVTDWAPRGSDESIEAILTVLREHPSLPAMLLGNHGLLAFGSDPQAAAELVVAMEEDAEAILQARVLGGAKQLPADALQRERQQMARFRASQSGCEV